MTNYNNVMGGCRCTYKDCMRSTTNTDNYHFFHFPIKDPNRCMLWIQNAKKLSFARMTHEQLRNKVVCQLHFEDSCFTNQAKKRLVHNAVPTLDGEGNESNIEILQSELDANVYSVDTNRMLCTSNAPNCTTYYYENNEIVPIKYSTTGGIIRRRAVSPTSTSAQPRVSDMRSTFTPSQLKMSGTSTSTYVPNRFKFKISEKDSKIVSNPPRGSNRTSTSTYVPTEYKTSDNESENECSYWRPSSYTNIFKNASKAAARMNSTVVAPPPSTAATETLDVVKLSKLVDKHTNEIAKLHCTVNKLITRNKTTTRLFRRKQSILNLLRGTLPASLFTIVSFYLCNEEMELDEDQTDFFTALYNSSPNTYSFLNETCNWKMPSIEAITTLDASDPSNMMPHNFDVSDDMCTDPLSN